MSKVGVGVVAFFSGADLAADNARAGNASGDIKAVAASLVEAKAAYDAFERTATAEREYQFAERAVTLQALISANQSAETIRIGLRLRFEDMLRAALVAYVADRSSPEGRLALHSGAVREVMQNFPEGPVAALASLDEGGCAGQQATPFERMNSHEPAGCAVLAQGQSAYVLVTGEGQRLPNFPLVVVGAGQGSYVLPLRYLYEPKALMRRPLPGGF